MSAATWYKLKSGVWGVKIRHDGQPNEQIEVTNKNGETKTVYLVGCAAKFDDAQLWSITDNAPQNVIPTRNITASGPKTLDEEPF
jgi:hypothetical protein